MHDLVIRGGTLIDGSGAAARKADLAIDGGVVTAVGEVGEGREEIDATGLLVTPGFVDMHTHYDAQVTWDPLLTPSGWHGVTTVVMGNCGVGFAPAAPDRHEWLIGLMEGVEDIPGSALAEGIDWRWESFTEYLDALEKMPRAMDFATQVPHGALRAYVMGERGAANEDATEDDIAAMARLLDEAIEAGALGFSTSRTSLHKSIDGELVPGTFAAKDELFGLGRVLAQKGRGVFQLACEHKDVPAELLWMEELARETGRPVMFNLSQFDQEPALWREVLDALEGMKDAPVYGQVAGRSIGVLHAWRGTAHPFAGCTRYGEVGWLPWEERLEKLRDPEIRRAIIDDEPHDLGEFGNFVTRSWHKMFPVEGGCDYEPEAARSVAAIAETTGKPPAEIAYDALMRDDGDGLLYFPLFNYSDGDLELLRTLHLHEQTRFGLSDAGAHCGAICDGGMPTFMLQHWARDRSRGEKLPLERVIQRQTRLPAETYGLLDRGLLAPGYRADVNLIDFDALDVDAPRLVWDLPAGGRRFIQKARGYKKTIVAGEVVWQDGEHTGALPGRLIRGPTRPAAATSPR
jgi:N-acyl-D-aspartate/D-glutamate deacylase